MVSKDKWYQLITELQALSQSGLAYTLNEFDKERYQRLLQISAELAMHCSNESLASIQNLFSFEKGYVTPKLDVRAFALKDDKILLVKERSDGLWSLPGGWADVNQTPAESAIREVEEESGYTVEVVKLLALWDKRKHNHPLQWPYIYKCFFHCQILGGEPRENIEISAIDFFPLEKLPPLSTHRVTEEQLLRLFHLVKDGGPTQFD